jgi:hypothetical protein
MGRLAIFADGPLLYRRVISRSSQKTALLSVERVLLRVIVVLASHHSMTSAPAIT